MDRKKEHATNNNIMLTVTFIELKLQIRIIDNLAKWHLKSKHYKAINSSIDLKNPALNVKYPDNKRTLLIQKLIKQKVVKYTGFNCRYDHTLLHRQILLCVEVFEIMMKWQKLEHFKGINGAKIY